MDLSALHPSSLNILISSLRVCFPHEFTSSLKAGPVSPWFTPRLSAWHIVGASQMVKARRNMKAAVPQAGGPILGAAVGRHPRWHSTARYHQLQLGSTKQCH